MRLLEIGLMSWLLVPLAETVAQTVVPDGPSCANCRIEIEVITRLGDLDGPGAIAGAVRDIAHVPVEQRWENATAARAQAGLVSGAIEPVQHRHQKPAATTQDCRR